MKYNYTLKKVIRKTIPDEPFEENLKPLLRLGEHISVKIRKRWNDISVYSDSDLGVENGDEIEHFEFHIKYKDRFFEFMKKNGIIFREEEDDTYRWIMEVDGYGPIEQ